MNDCENSPNPLSLPQLIDANEVAKILSVSLRTVRRLDAEHQLPPRGEIGRLVRWYQPAILAWIMHNRHQRSTLAPAAVVALPDTVPDTALGETDRIITGTVPDSILAEPT